MKKKLLFLLPLMLFALTMPLRAATCNWGYANSVVSGQFGSMNSAKGAIYIPAEIAKMYEGCQLTHVRVGLAGKATKVKVFLTKDLNVEAYIAQRTQKDLLSGFNEVKFPEAWTIDGEGFYIGYEYESEDFAMGLSSMYNENGCWADLGDGWKNYAEAEGACALAIQAKIKGDELPTDFSLMSANDILAEAGKAFNIKITVRNMSSIIGRRFQFGYSIDGGEEILVEQKQTVGTDLEKEFSIEHSGFAALGKHSVTVRLVSINGNADDYEGNNSVTSTIRVMNTLPLQRMVVEEGTGTWCQYCPVGIEGFRSMAEKHPDTFVGIAVHKSDAYETSSYSSLTFTGYPSSYVMRDLSSAVRPSADNLETVYKAVTAEAPVAAVGLVAGFTNSSRSQITARTNLNFFSARSGMNYRLSFVLLENGLDDYQTGLGYTTLDHVARMNYSYLGFENSVPTSVEEGEDVESFINLDVPSNVNNRNNIELVALLLDKVSGKIINAAKCKISDDVPVTGIAEAHEVAVPSIGYHNGQLQLNGYSGTVTVFDASGKQVSGENLAPGLYILRGTDGKHSFSTKLVVR